MSTEQIIDLGEVIIDLPYTVKNGLDSGLCNVRDKDGKQIGFISELTIELKPDQRGLIPVSGEKYVVDKNNKLIVNKESGTFLKEKFRAIAKLYPREFSDWMGGEKKIVDQDAIDKDFAIRCNERAKLLREKVRSKYNLEQISDGSLIQYEKDWVHEVVIRGLFTDDIETLFLQKLQADLLLVDSKLSGTKKMQVLREVDIIPVRGFNGEEKVVVSSLIRWVDK